MTVQNSTKTIRKGELLFREGEAWGSMYLITKGQLRVFKKKGDQQIEIDTLRPGQILGEMGFLDQQPRSASAEAIIDTEVVEISQQIYAATFVNIPEWVKVLLKAIVARLRATTVKVKNLESASSEVDYSEKGVSKRSYVFLSSHDRLKLAMAVLLVAARGRSADEKNVVLPATGGAAVGAPPVAPEVKLRMMILERYANQILSLPLAKITTFLDALKTAGIVRYAEDGSGEMYLTNEADLDAYVHFVCDENLLTPDKRHDLTARAFTILEAIHASLPNYTASATTGLTTVNIVDVLKWEIESGKPPFRLDEFDELVKVGYASQLTAVSSTEQTTLIQGDVFRKAYRVQKIVQVFEALNDEKDRLGKVA